MKITRKDVLFAIITNVVLLLGIPMTGAGQESRPLSAGIEEPAQQKHR
jgi:hypothetical protein